MLKERIKMAEPLFSLEVFPPKKNSDFPAVFQVLDELKALAPDFISVTYGAGGSNSKKTVEIASYIQNHCGIDALAHMTCVGVTKESLDQNCQELLKENVTNILALRGDRPAAMTDEQFAARSFSYASDMMKYLEKYQGLTLAGACYPEKHFEAPSLEADLIHLKEKAEAGAALFITQLFFDNEFFYRFLDRMDQMGIKVPVAAGIMPVTSAKRLGTTVSLSGSSVPKKMSDLIAKYGDNPADMEKAGTDYAISQILDLLAHGARGIHLYTMNKSKTASDILRAVR